MLNINCPWCGPRPHSEFSYGGDASAPLAGIDPAESPDKAKAQAEAIYLRPNPCGRHKEFWHHLSGCRQWLVVERDTLTHQIFSVAYATASPKKAKKPAKPKTASPKKAATKTSAKKAKGA